MRAADARHACDRFLQEGMRPHPTHQFRTIDAFLMAASMAEPDNLHCLAEEVTKAKGGEQ